MRPKSLVHLAFTLLFIWGSVMAEDNKQAVPVVFESEGYKISGQFFLADGKGPFPTVILLHGIPGGEGDLFGLGQHLNKVGVNAFTFNYRGTWKSEGVYVPSTSIEDVISAIKYIKSPDMVTRFLIDTTKLSIIGYSYGGGMALLGAALENGITNVVSMAGGDLKVVADFIEKSQEYRLMHRQFLDECMEDSNAVRGLGGEASHEWLLKNRDKFDLLKYAEALSQKRVLLLGGWKDFAIPVEDHILPLFRAIQKFSPERLQIKVYDCDHSFEGVRDQLTTDIISWIKNE
jgi:uncharacterized protein